MAAHHHLSKKEKKKLLYKKNRAQERLFQLMRLRRAEAARIKEIDDRSKPKKSDKKVKKGWSDKTVSIRNRLTGKKRASKERWNRFAGTSDAGSRGL